MRRIMRLFLVLTMIPLAAAACGWSAPTPAQPQLQAVTLAVDGMT
jgi:hypothetical protein